MYDPRNEPREFVAETADEAIDKAGQFFGLSRDALEVHEPEAGSVYGLGGRALVVAVPRGRVKKTREPRESGGSGPRREDRSRRRDRGRDRPPERPVERLAESEPPEPSIGTARTPLGPVGEFVLGLIERLDLGPFEIAESVEGDLRVLQVEGHAARTLASGEGRGVDAMQLLANQVSVRNDGETGRVVLDVEGSAEAREALLTRLAKRAASRAQDTDRSIGLDPMNPRDRRVIHLALREAEGVATMSVGEGRYRQVVVVPEGAPEYEEAKRQSEMAARDEPE